MIANRWDLEFAQVQVRGGIGWPPIVDPELIRSGWL
jgi:hypothetical protein